MGIFDKLFRRGEKRPSAAKALNPETFITDLYTLSKETHPSVTEEYMLVATKLDEATKEKQKARASAQRVLDLINRGKKNK